MRRRKVSWHGSGRWCFTTTAPNGKRKFHYANPNLAHTPEGRRKAMEWMERILDAQERHVVRAEGYTLDDLRLLYLSWSKARVGKGEAVQETYDGHRKSLGLICGTPHHGMTYGHLEARMLTGRDMADLVRGWEGKSPTTIRNRLGSLQAMLNWAATPLDTRPVELERLIEVNPIAGMALPKVEYQGDRYAPAHEVGAFVGWVEAAAELAKGKELRFERMLAVLVRFVAETGARPKEACRLEWRHYDAAKRVVVLPPREHKTGRKTGRSRVVPVPAGLAERLDALAIDPARHPTHVFTHRFHRPGMVGSKEDCRHGLPWNTTALCRRIASLREQAIEEGAIPAVKKGLKRMHLYRLRHTKITNDVQRAERVSDVAARHGNSVKVIESTYLHDQIDHILKAAQQMDSDGE